jgi:predicted Rossmann fold flavoprotein
MQNKIVIIGGGAAGFFAAIACAEANPDVSVLILEKAAHVLQKVKISGGGRCNVTHACFVDADLVQYYPRGSKELRGPFSRFGPADTMEWFADRGVDLKIEEDNRVFPVTDKSQTILDCLTEMAEGAGVKVYKNVAVTDIRPEEKKWQVKTTNGDYQADTVLIASGNSKKLWDILKRLGHTIVEPVPSLFTFNIKDPRLKGLAGISMPQAEVTVANSELIESGPLLITHWGLSGPAILKLSAWGAFELAHRFYHFPILVNWLGHKEFEEVLQTMLAEKATNPRKRMQNHAMFDVPLRLWKSLADFAGISATANWADLSNKQIQDFANDLTASVFQVSGKSTFKDEFVTAGGVDLADINMKRFESKICPNLFVAGEALNIDALTGGFNFQAAWTGGWLAGHAMAGEELS